jgi:hypothetical protein
VLKLDLNARVNFNPPKFLSAQPLIPKTPKKKMTGTTAQNITKPRRADVGRKNTKTIVAILLAVIAVALLVLIALAIYFTRRANSGNVLS